MGSRRIALAATALVLVGSAACGGGDGATERGAHEVASQGTVGTPAVHSSPRPKRTPKPPRFSSIDEAVAFMRSRVEVTVVLPPLPPGTHFGRLGISREGGVREAQLYLDAPDGYLFLQFGGAEFDGCGADSAFPVEVAGVPGLANRFQSGRTHVVWPATPGDPEGDYGLETPYGLRRTLALAAVMEERRTESGGTHPPGGC